MNILSYRGPSTPGGVSATLSRVIEQTSDAQQWWYLHGSELRKKPGKFNSAEEVCQIPFKVVGGHYRYCNEFLWPVLHELPQYASCNEVDRAMYRQFNMSFAWNVLRAEEISKTRKAFVNDYQLALGPRFLTECSNRSVDVFWHIPWPGKVEPDHVQHLVEIASGLLSAEKIGFHIDQYADNFLSFVDAHLDEFSADFQMRRVIRNDGTHAKIVSHPLGVDSDYWLTKLKEESHCCREVNIKSLLTKQFVLSVDRADYTKGVFQRLQAIEYFFNENRDQIGKITFVQICQKTRVGLSTFEDYWQECRYLAESINRRWSNGDWQPIVWIDKPVSANVLAWLYKRASVMLVTPIFDGLNLTAKEFALCSRDGVLILSARTGAWQELQDHVLTLVSLKPETISSQIKYALSMPRKDRKERVDRLRENVLSNTLASWWRDFGGSSEPAEKVVPMSIKIHHPTRRSVSIAK